LCFAGACSTAPQPDARRHEPAPATATAALTAAQGEAQEEASEAQPSPASAPAACDAAKKLVFAQRFTLAKPHVYSWMKGHAPISEGTLIVVEVEPACARPRQTAMPVLYAGGVPVEVANLGFPSGRVIAIVPGEVDLAAAPIFYGSPELPERIDAATGASELAAARARGVAPFSAEERRAAFDSKPLALQGTDTLYVAVADLIDRFVPDEADRAKSYRAK
jgi:hypothetical protein